MIKTPQTSTLFCQKSMGGKRTLWHARHPGYRLCGSGNSADNAIKDWQKQFRAAVKNGRHDYWKV